MHILNAYETEMPPYIITHAYSAIWLRFLQGPQPCHSAFDNTILWLGVSS